jgi:hypothetical protein
MLKRITILVLIFVVFVANFSTVLVYVGFKLNRQFIAANLCINRLKPGLHCNGHCYFMRKIKQAEDSEKKQASRGSSSRVEISFFQEPFSISFIEPQIVDKAPVGIQIGDYKFSSQYLDTIFRPPKSFV